MIREKLTTESLPKTKQEEIAILKANTRKERRKSLRK
jgi:hypothetical protein